MRADAISGIAAKLADEYSRDPCYIARSLGIIVNFEPLYRLNGFYNTAYRQKFIHINSQLSHRAQRFVCAHELGHAILHPDNNTHFLRNHTLYPISRYEKEATYFLSVTMISMNIGTLRMSSLAKYLELTRKSSRSELKGYKKALCEG